MLLHPYARGPGQLDDLTDFSGSITTGATVQALLPQQLGRVVFYFENTSAALLSIYIGPPPVTVTVSGGAVTAVTVADNGSNWLVAPQVVLMGGIFAGNTSDRPGSPNMLLTSGAWPGQVAQVQATLSGSALSTFNIVNGGSGYKVAPTAKLVNPMPLLGAGAGTPSATVGFTVAAGGSLSFEHTFCPTSAMNIFGGTTGQTFTCKVLLN